MKKYEKKLKESQYDILVNKVTPLFDNSSLTDTFTLKY